jgi:hypothetical protein
MSVDEEKDLITPPEEPGDEPKEGDKDKEGGEAPSEETVPKSSLDAANKKVAEMGDRITELTDTLISPDFLKGQQKPTVEEGEKEPSEEDLENMSRKDYANHIVNKTIGAVGVVISNLVQRQEFFETKKAQDDTITKYPDYWDYKSEMIGLSKRYPGVSPEDIYLIACGKKNPPVKPPVPKATPSEKPGITTEFKDKKLSAKEAADIAWDRTMGNK